MNTLLSDCGLVDARINASEKDLPVLRNVTEVRLSLALEQGHMLIDCCNLRFEFILGINRQSRPK